MKTGLSEELTRSHKSLILSLLTVYVEEVSKRALLYVLHNERGMVTRDDMFKAMCYEILHEDGVGNKLRPAFDEALTTSILEESVRDVDDENVRLRLRAIQDHMGAIDARLPELGSTKEEAVFVVNRVLGEFKQEDNVDESEGEDEDVGILLCKCEMCVFMNNATSVWETWSPRDAFERLIYSSLSKTFSV